MEKDVESLTDLANEIQPEHVGHMPVIAHFCDAIGIANIVNDCLPGKSVIDPGINVVAMILDTLSGRSPLYKVEEFIRTQDTELLLGRAIPAEAFNDDALGRTLDKIHEYGTLKLFTNISLNAANIYNLRSHQGSFDTTSVNLWGNYENSKPSQKSPHITYGYSKDKRPDLKQFMISMLCIEGNIPISGKMQNGNASDNQLNNEELQRLSSLLQPLQRQTEDFIYVADCKVITSSNLALLKNSKFISRLPASYKEHDKAIQKALDSHNWTPLGVLAETPSNSTKRVRSSYKSHETFVLIDDTKYRAIVIQTDELDKRKTKAIKRQRDKQLTQTTKEIKAQKKQPFHCLEDAENALTDLTKPRTNKYWNLTGKIITTPIYARGRAPKNGNRRIVRQDYHLELEAISNKEYHEGKLLRSGCFVMLTNLTESEKSSKETLKIYKEQYGIEQNFSFLKEPLIVNDTFLKTPGRIDALVMILLLSLLIWNLIQHLLRKSDQSKNGQLKDLNKRPTKRPTTYLFISHINHTLILKRGNERCLPRNGISEQAKKYLSALGLDESIFTKPAPTPKRSNTSQACNPNY
jgi:transposase